MRISWNAAALPSRPFASHTSNSCRMANCRNIGAFLKTKPFTNCSAVSAVHMAGKHENRQFRMCLFDFSRNHPTVHFRHFIIQQHFIHMVRGKQCNPWRPPLAVRTV